MCRLGDSHKRIIMSRKRPPEDPKLIDWARYGGRGRFHYTPEEPTVDRYMSAEELEAHMNSLPKYFEGQTWTVQRAGITYKMLLTFPGLKRDRIMSTQGPHPVVALDLSWECGASTLDVDGLMLKVDTDRPTKTQRDGAYRDHSTVRRLWTYVIECATVLGCSTVQLIDMWSNRSGNVSSAHLKQFAHDVPLPADITAEINSQLTTAAKRIQAVSKAPLDDITRTVIESWKEGYYGPMGFVESDDILQTMTVPLETLKERAAHTMGYFGSSTFK